MQAIGFDLGGTLVQHPGLSLSWQAHYMAALQAMANACGVSPDEASLEVAARLLAGWNTRLNPRTVETTADRVFGPILCFWSVGLDRLDVAVDAFFGYFARFQQPDPLAVMVLQELRRRGWRTGVLSDVAYGMPYRLLEHSVASAGLRELVDVLVGSVEVGARKPRPEGFSLLARCLQADPTTMLYSGDEPKDIAGAQAAGMRGVLYVPQGDAPAYGQWRTIRSLDQLLELDELGTP